ncbi:MAG TPA: hypothetical protein VGI35_03220 [Steroidobacteraceae bacterium]
MPFATADQSGTLDADAQDAAWSRREPSAASTALVFHLGTHQRVGHAHIVWELIGTHAEYDREY